MNAIMNAIEAYQASSTCVCGGIPFLDQSSDGSETRILCQCCGMAGPICETPEQAVHHWNMMVEAMTSTATVTDIMCRSNLKMAEVLGKKPARDPGPVLDAARACYAGLQGAWELLMTAIAEYDAE